MHFTETVLVKDFALKIVDTTNFEFFQVGSRLRITKEK